MKKNQQKTRSHIAKLSADATTTAAPVPPSSPTPPGATSEAHLAASSNKAWQGLAGVGRQLQRGRRQAASSLQSLLCGSLPAEGHNAMTCRGGLKDSLWRLRLLSSSSPSSSLPRPWRNTERGNCGMFFFVHGGRCSRALCVLTGAVCRQQRKLLVNRLLHYFVFMSTEDTRQTPRLPRREPALVREIHASHTRLLRRHCTNSRWSRQVD